MIARTLCPYGLSPRVWGKLRQSYLPAKIHGSIPTGMGKTNMGVEIDLLYWVYPHGYGENFILSSPQLNDLGLSPRVWGKLETLLQEVFPVRSIPTGMGKTLLALSVHTVLAVYPHGYGENEFWLYLMFPGLGLSPRVWGKHIPYRRENKSSGSIPTGMGKT